MLTLLNIIIEQKGIVLIFSLTMFFFAFIKDQLNDLKESLVLDQKKSKDAFVEKVTLEHILTKVELHRAETTKNFEEILRIQAASNQSWFNSFKIGTYNVLASIPKDSIHLLVQTTLVCLLIAVVGSKLQNSSYFAWISGAATQVGYGLNKVALVLGLRKALTIEEQVEKLAESVLAVEKSLVELSQTTGAKLSNLLDTNVHSTQFLTEKIVENSTVTMEFTRLIGKSTLDHISDNDKVIMSFLEELNKHQVLVTEKQTERLVDIVSEIISTKVDSGNAGISNSLQEVAHTLGSLSARGIETVLFRLEQTSFDSSNISDVVLKAAVSSDPSLETALVTAIKASEACLLANPNRMSLVESSPFFLDIFSNSI